MKVEESQVQKSTQTVKLLDKKMRTREYTANKYLIILKDSTIFQDREKVKIINQTDFEKLGLILQELREETKLLKKQVNVLEDVKNTNEKEINKLEREIEYFKNNPSITRKIKNII